MYLHISALAKVCAATNNVDAGWLMINDIRTVVVCCGLPSCEL
jgi:hypothetical protein